MRRPFQHILLLLLTCLCGTTGLAQRVYWNLESPSMGIGKVTPLSLVFEECTPAGDIRLPEVPEIDFGTPSVSNQTTMINFRTSRRAIYTYPVQPKQRGSVTIPTFSVETDKGKQVVSGIGFEVGDASVGQTGVAIKDIVESRLRLPKSTVWAGEVVEAEYLLIASGRYQASISSVPQWKDSRFVAEAFGEPERIEVTIAGERRPAVRYRTRLIVNTPGRQVLEPVRQDVTIQTGERSTFFFSQPRLEEFSIASNQPELVVQPLPQPTPADFTGAIGSFTLESKIVPDSVRVGEPITWTLTLAGDGNWIAGLRLPEREVSTDFQVVQPKSREEIASGKMFTGSLVEDAVLVPTRAGAYQLGPVPFSYFDPKAGKYVKSPISASSLDILPPANARAAVPVAPAASGAAGAASGSGADLTAPTALSGLPGDLPSVPPLPSDPLGNSGTGMIPFPIAPAWWLLAAFIPPMLTWLGLAWREVRRADPVLGRRRARSRMLELLARIGRHPEAPSARELEEWRTLCLEMWAVPRAAPDGADIRAALELSRGSTTPAVWAELWQECELALFRPGQQLGSDWVTRALHAAREARLRRTAPAFPHRWRHWAPATAVLVSALLGGPGAGRAEAAATPEEAYRAGHYEEARSLWAARLAGDPADWVAHHNVALAYAQEERWSPAAAHWLAAFLLNPRNATVRANLALALGRMDGVDPQLRHLLRGSRINRVVTLLSPGEWQVAFLAGAAVSAAGLVGMVGALYRKRRRLVRRAGLAAAVAGFLLSLSALYAEHRYGGLARPMAGMVVEPTLLRSIPSDLAEEQQTAPLPPGVLVVAGRSFLGWDQVETSSAASGWVRRESIIRFFHPVRPPLPAAGEKTEA